MIILKDAGCSSARETRELLHDSGSSTQETEECPSDSFAGCGNETERQEDSDGVECLHRERDVMSASAVAVCDPGTVRLLSGS